MMRPCFLFSTPSGRRMMRPDGVFIYLCIKNKTTMNYIDMTVAGSVAVGMIIGLRKGLIREVAGMVALAIGIVGARLIAPQLTPWIGENLGATPEWSRLIAWTACFFGLGYGINLLARFMTRTLGMMALGGVNKLLGAIFGGIKYILLFSVLFNLIALASEHVRVPGEEMREQSILYHPVKQVAGWSLDFIKRIRTDAGTPPETGEETLPTDETEQPILKTV